MRSPRRTSRSGPGARGEDRSRSSFVRVKDPGSGTSSASATSSWKPSKSASAASRARSSKCASLRLHARRTASTGSKSFVVWYVRFVSPSSEDDSRASSPEEHTSSPSASSSARTAASASKSPRYRSAATARAAVVMRVRCAIASRAGWRSFVESRGACGGRSRVNAACRIEPLPRFLQKKGDEHVDPRRRAR